MQPYTGATRYVQNSDGLIAKHLETWDTSIADVFISALAQPPPLPSPLAPKPWRVCVCSVCRQHNAPVTVSCPLLQQGTNVSRSRLLIRSVFGTVPLQSSQQPDQYYSFHMQRKIVYFAGVFFKGFGAPPAPPVTT